MDSAVANSSSPRTPQLPSTSEQFLERSSSWTLACDNAVLNRLKAFSEKVSRQSQEILQECDNLSTEIDLLNARVQTVTNEFLILSNTQFTENRVEEFQEMLPCVNPTSQNVPIKTKAEKEAELIAKMKEAIKIGVTIKTQQQMKRDNLHETMSSPPYVIKKLPHIIGTPKFFSSRYCGLADEVNLNLVPENSATSTIGNEENIVNPTSPTVSQITDSNPNPELPSFNTQKKPSKNDNFEDIFFPSRELYVPPAINQSFYKEGSPSSDDQFIHRRTPSTAASSSSNLAPESEKKDGSDTSSVSGNKPQSVMDDIETSLRHGLPPPIVDDNSDSDEDDFRPPELGTGLGKSIFADDDDEDMFGNSSLFRSKGSTGANEDLFFNKPATTINSLFGQNTRATPVLLPSVPPPISPNVTPQPQRATPPSLDSHDTGVSSKGVSSGETLDNGNSAPSAIDPKWSSVSDTSNKHFLEDVKSPLSNVVKNSVGDHNQVESLSQTERAKIDQTTSVDNASSPSPSLSLISETTESTTEKHVEKEKEAFIPKPGKSFVKSMALGLKIDPATLNPGAKFPARRPSPTQNLAKDFPPAENVSENTVQDKNKSAAEVGHPTSQKTEYPKISKRERSPSVESSNAKAIAAEIQINPAALIPGSKRPTPQDSTAVQKPIVIESAPSEDISTNPVIVKSSSDITPKTVKPPSEPRGPTAVFAEVEQFPNTEISKPQLPAPTGTVAANPTPTAPSIGKSASQKVKSIFDADSSDDDLFKPKSTNNLQSQKHTSSSLFSEKSPDWISRSASKVKNSSGDVSRTQLKPKVKKSIFDDSDSDDDLFGTKSINTKKTSVLFAESNKDDIMSGNRVLAPQPVSEVGYPGSQSSGINHEVKQSIPTPTVVTKVEGNQAQITPQYPPTTNAPPQNAPLHNASPQNPSTQNAPPQNSSTQNAPPHNPSTQNAPLQKPSTQNAPLQNPSTQNPPPQNTPTQNAPPQNPSTHNAPPQNPSTQNAPTQKDLPKPTSVSLFSNEEDSDKESESTSFLNSKKPKSQSISSSKLFTGKSIFGDSDSDDEDLFKPSKKNKGASKGHVKVSGETTIPVNTSTSYITESTSTDLFQENNIESEKAFDTSDASATAKLPTMEIMADEKIGNREHESMATDHHLIDGSFARNGSKPSVEAHGLNKSISSPRNFPIGDSTVDYEKGTSFEDPVPATLLPNMVKSRAKVTARSRRPPTRKTVTVSREASDDMSSSANQLTSEDETETFRKPVDLDQSE